MKNRVLSVFGLITNIAIVAMVAFCVVSFHVPLFGPNDPTPISVYLYFTVMSNLFVGLVALIEIPFFIKSIAKRRDQIPTFLYAAKLAAVTTVTITMGTALSWLAIQLGFETIIKGSQLFLHVIIPSLALLSFVIIESQAKIRFRHVFWVVLPVLLYAGFYFSAIFFFDIGAKDWYMFAYDYVEGVRSENINIVKSIISIISFVLGPIVLAIVIWLLNQLFHKIFFVRKPLPKPEDTKTPEGKKVVIIEDAKKTEEKPAEEPVKEEAPAPVEEEPVEEPEEEKVEVAPAEEEDEMPNVPEYRGKTETITAEESKPVKKASKPAKKAESAKKPAAEKKSEKKAEKKAPAKKAAAPVAASEFGKYEGKTRVYHIAQSKTVDGQWQVKLAGGDRAVKIFKTQKEAIEFAKGLVRTQGGSIRIHSMKGKMRK